MKISCNWIRDYVDSRLDADEMASVLTSTGLEVETFTKWESIRGSLANVVTGSVVSCEKHPDADKLKVCKVNVGSGELLNIVCGAPNVSEGQKVIVARIGAVLYPTGKEDPFIIQKAKIRGVTSEGMICAEDELGIGTSHDGIMILPEDAPVGIPAADYFEIEIDEVLEIGLTPNRSDAISHIGVARDLMAAVNFRNQDEIILKIPEISLPSISENPLPVKVLIVNNAACKRYTGMTIRDVVVGPSPRWLINRLLAVGIKPINNVVDISNFVLHETGHPLHAFDLDKISGGCITVKNYPEGTSFTTLDGVERKLTAEDLMISDAEKPLCMAGVYGGLHSGVTSETKSVFLESAWFDPVSVRRTSKYHLLNTDASFRFERGADPAITPYALKRAAALICEIAGGKPASEMIDVGEYAASIPQQEILLRYKQLEIIAGVKIPEEKILQILHLLDFKILSLNKTDIRLLSPSYRVDVTREADVIEEILRIFGMDNVPVPSAIPVSFPVEGKSVRVGLRNLVGHHLASIGFSEAWNNSLSASRMQNLVSEICEGFVPVKVLNPLSSDLDVLRTSLLPGLIENLRYNINRQVSDLKLFEFGTVYAENEKASKKGDITARFLEEQKLAVVITGMTSVESWQQKASSANVFDLKMVAEEVVKLTGFPFETIQIETRKENPFLYNASGTWMNRSVLKFGEVHPEILRQFGVKQPVYYLLFDWNVLVDIADHTEKRVAALPKFPEVRRDLSLVVAKSVTFAEIKNIILKSDNLIRQVNLFDIFESDSLPDGKVSVAVCVTLLHDEKTLSDKEIDTTMNKVVKNLTEKINAHLR
jgi:phenylalanyl-tRNA synthetase beta chain